MCCCHSKLPSLRQKHSINQEMKNSSITGRQHTSCIISWDVLHSRGACQKIITASRDASGHGAAKVHYKSQPSPVLPHPLLWTFPPWEPGECEILPCPPHSSTGQLISADLLAAISSVPCQILGLLVVGEGSGEQVCHGGSLGVYYNGFLARTSAVAR